MQNATPLRTVFIVELLFLALSFPILYFPKYFPFWSLVAGFAVLAAGWCWRRWQLGFWRVATPIDWPLFLLFFVMLPISLWAAPEPLRQQYSLPRAYILVWNFCLFWVVVIYSSLERRFFYLCLAGFIAAGTAIALVAPLGTNWLYKFPLLDPLLRRIPSPLIGVFQGADSGFHPNQVAGTLLYVLPLMLALVVGRIRQRDMLWWLLAGVTVVVLASFAVMQSRSGMMGLLVGVMIMLLLPSKRGRWLLGLGAILAVVIFFLSSNTLLAVISDSPPAEALGGTGTLGFRQEVWGAAVQGIYDFSFTGMGLGTFRTVVRLLYPVSISPDYDIGHAHNVFLQSALDFGIAGMVALIAIYLLTSFSLYPGWQTNPENDSKDGYGIRLAALGLVGSLWGQLIYSQLDTVAMGSKTNFMFWTMLALSLARTIAKNRTNLPVENLGEKA